LKVAFFVFRGNATKIPPLLISCIKIYKQKTGSTFQSTRFY
jgi:hypothetical protein